MESLRLGCGLTGPLTGEKMPQLVPAHFNCPRTTLVWGIFAREADLLAMHSLRIAHKELLSPFLFPGRDAFTLRR